MSTENKINPVKKKLTCKGCRASENHNECSLGYGCRDWKPQSICPKPRTYEQLIAAQK